MPCASSRHGKLHLFPPLLPLLLCDLEEVAHERCVALGIGQLVGVDVADGTNDGLGEGILVQLQGAQEVHRACNGTRCIQGSAGFAARVQQLEQALG